MSATVWQLSSPRYPGGDAESAHTNGELDWPCDVPSFACDECRRARSGEDERQVPLWLSEADADLLGQQEDFDTPEAYDAFMTDFAQRVEADPRNSSFVAGWPGRRTILPLPLTVRVPAAPTAAVLHPSGELLIRGDVAEALMAMPPTGAELSPVRVVVSRSGRSRPSARFDPGPSPPLSAPQPYSLLTMTEVTGPPLGVTRRSCPRCRHVVDEWKDRHLTLPSSAWRQEVDLAFMATTTNVLVSDRVKRLLERDPRPNVAFSPVCFR